ncbi:cathepsin D [Carabus blaptoides fortunei]
MWQFMIVLIFTPVICAKEEGITIPLFRQKTPREIGVNIKNIEGINTDWLKPKPEPTNDSVALYRYLDNEFYAVIQIGKKARPFNMVLDTAWGDSWIISQDCPYTTIGCWFHNKYDHTQSSTYKENGTAVSINMDTYNFTGYYSEDTFHLAQMNVTNQTFIEIDKVPYIYIFYKADGVLGLGYSSLARGVNPVFYNLIKQGRIKKALFSIYLNRDRQSNRGGNVYFGRIEDRHILQNETITYLPVNQTGYWQFKMDKIIVDIAKIEYPFCETGCQAIADTSSNAIYGPSFEVKKLNKLLKARYLMFGRYRVNCETVNKLPVITFVIGGKEFSLKGRDYVQKLSYKSLTLCLSAFMEAKTYDSNIWVLGGAFLSEYFSIYDLEHNKIGFVKAA